MKAIFRKELADHFSSWRLAILFVLVFLTSAAGLYSAQQGIRGAATGTEFIFLRLFTAEGEILPPLTTFIVLLVPIIGIALGFDAINREYSSGTISGILSQPIFRDSVINGKFLAGLVTLSTMMMAIVLIVAGFGLTMIGIPPTSEEIIRLFLYLFFIIVYGAFWLGVAMLFSILFRRIATSLLTSIALWLLFSFFIALIAPAIANAIAPTANGTEAVIQNFQIQQTIMRISPNYLFSEVTTVLLLPEVRSLGLVTLGEVVYMILNPLPLVQSLIIIWPHLTSLLSITMVCFAAGYIVFMRQEIRAV